MILLQGNNLSKAFAGEPIFANVNFAIKDKARVALVGRNGAGKSTLLKLIIGEDEPSTGEISTTKGLTIGYLAQHADLSSDKTILAELESVFVELQARERELRQMEAQMSELTGAELDKLMKDYDAKSVSFSNDGGFTYEAELHAILNAFQFTEETWQTPVSSLSGGQRTRLALAKMLLSAPDLLVLDEPTNHLDIETLAWLENYLKSYQGALLIVSHDRYFLDQTAKEVYELAHGQLKHYVGNYSDYIEASELDRLTAERAYEKQQKEIADLEDFVNRNLVRASTTKRAQSRRKKLEKMERIEAPTADSKSVNLTFWSEKTSGKEVLQISDASIGYLAQPADPTSDKTVLSKNINLEVQKFDSIAIVGPNGIGKSTLIKSALGQIPFLAGQAKLGANVTLGYYDQQQENLTVSNTVLDELWNEHRLLPEVEIRNVLGAFLFSGDDVKKTVGMLSGGEKSRLLLAKLSMEHDNFLVLDEPTNHLDIDSREVLENSLINYDGTLLFVSHDRYFINRVATKVIELSPEGAKLYLGDYDYYLEKKAEEKEKIELQSEKTSESNEVKADSREAQKSKARENRKIEREIAELENKMESLDQQIQALQENMAQNSADFTKLAEQQVELDQMQSEKDTIEERWLELQEVIES